MSILGTVPNATNVLAGSVPWETVDIVTDVPGIAVFVGGVDQSPLLQLASLSVREELNMRGEAKFTLISKTGNLHVKIGEPVTITFNSRIIFAGDVEKFEEYVPDNTVCMFVTITAIDYNAILDRHLVNYIYEDMTLRAIVQDIISTRSGDSGQTIADDGVTYTNSSLQLGPTFERVVFKHLKASEAINKLCEMAGYSWWIDFNKVFYAQDSATNYAPQPLDATIHGNYGHTRHTQDREKYRNIQYLEAGRAMTAPTTDASARIESIVADGKQRTYTVPLPLAAKPVITVGGTPVSENDIGIREKDETAKWWYEIGSEQVSQNPDETVITNGTEVQIKYQGYYPILQKARNDTEIAARALVEGTSGTYATIESDTDIDDLDLAQERCTRLLDRHDQISPVFTCYTYSHGYHAGQLVDVVDPDYELSDTFLIESVSFNLVTFDTDEPFRYQLRCIANGYQGSWVDFFRRLATRGRPYLYAENETIHDLRVLQDSITVSDTLVWWSGDTRIDEEDNWLTWCQVEASDGTGGSWIAGKRDAWADNGDAVGTVSGAWIRDL